MDAALAFALSLWPTPEPPKEIVSAFPCMRRGKQQYHLAKGQTDRLRTVLDLYGLVDEYKEDAYLYGGGWHGKQTLKAYRQAKKTQDAWSALYRLSYAKGDENRGWNKWQLVEAIGVDRYNARLKTPMHGVCTFMTSSPVPEWLDLASTCGLVASLVTLWIGTEPVSTAWLYASLSIVVLSLVLKLIAWREGV